ncbi:DUF1405 domain-containing protein [Staphylococcus sp. Marseille-Q1834]|uniref:DUF1405 domain-containing protein n=1 Tax=Staphylococcus sp. Marseille-Q1834 TaxID=2866594 RepID=UPI0012B6E484|nr:DUF1405 domain-containing protein [Staphylococcus sp. Marseille-Q1834]
MLNLKQFWELTLFHRTCLMFLLICNFGGTIYGFIWYSDQLNKAPWYFLPFIPDSPIASLFLCVAIIGLLVNKRNSIIEALAFVTLVKYGLWAVIMNVIMIYYAHDITIMNIFLIMSHGIMAIEALYFYPRFTISMHGLFIAIICIFNNDYIDYVLGKYPYYNFIAAHTAMVGYIAFILSILAIIMYYYLQFVSKFKLFDYEGNSQ